MQQSPYCSFLGLDRSDRKTDITSRSPDGHQAVTDSILAKPRKWLAWIEQLRQRYPTGRFALCVEMPAANIVAFFSQFDFIDIFPINPSTLSNFREAFVTSRCKDDPTDSWWLSELVRVHQDKLTVWEPDTAQSRLLIRLVEDRRGVVAHRTRLSNQLKDLLKNYFPQALDLIGERLYAPLAQDFLHKWPTLQTLKTAHTQTVIKFYHQHRCVRQSALQKRLLIIEKSIPLSDDPALLQGAQQQLLFLLDALRNVRSHIHAYDKHIDTVFAEHPDAFIFDSLPGAATVYRSRLLAAFGSNRHRFDSPEAMQKFSGIAPVLKRSGNKSWVQRRYACPTFLRQSFHEYAGESIRHSAWARAFYAQQAAKGKRHHTIIRALAFKWIRVLWKCWMDRIPYDEMRYLRALKRSNSPLYKSALELLPEIS